MERHFEPVTCIATSVLTVLLFVSTTTLNGFLLYVIYKDPLNRLRKPVTSFITAITVMDLLTGLLCDTSQAISEIRCALKMNTETQFELGSFNGIATFFTVNSATLLILAMSTERFIAVGFPYFYRQRVTRKRSRVIAVCICMYSFVFSILQLTSVDLGTYETVDVYLHTVVPIITVIIIYIAISCMLRSQRKKLSYTDTDGDGRRSCQLKSGTNKMNDLKREKKLVFAAFLIALLLLLAFLPYTVMVTTSACCESCKSKDWFIFIGRIAMPFVFTNSAANPFVFALRMRDIQKSIKVILSRSFARDTRL